MAQNQNVKTNAAATVDRNPVYKAASNEMKTLRTTIEQSTGKWALNKDSAGFSLSHKVK